MGDPEHGGFVARQLLAHGAQCHHVHDRVGRDLEGTGYAVDYVEELAVAALLEILELDVRHTRDLGHRGFGCRLLRGLLLLQEYLGKL